MKTSYELNCTNVLYKRISSSVHVLNHLLQLCATQNPFSMGTQFERKSGKVAKAGHYPDPVEINLEHAAPAQNARLRA